MEVRVDRQACLGSGQCAMFVPEVFDQSETDGLVLLLTPRPGAELGAELEAAAERCPAGAITLSGG